MHNKAKEYSRLLEKKGAVTSFLYLPMSHVPMLEKDSLPHLERIMNSLVEMQHHQQQNAADYPRARL